MTNRRRMLRSLALGAMLCVAALPALAQNYPQRSVRIIVPAAAGGVLDLTARVIGQHLSDKLGQQFIVENRPGAGGVVGVTAALGAAADGYTLLVAHSGEMAINPALMRDLPYQPQRDFEPVAPGMRTPLLWAANAASPYQTLQQFIDAARAEPGKIAYASAGNGTLNHIIGEMFAAEAKVSLLHVPYRGGGPASAAVAGGEVPTGLLAVSSSAPHVRSGRMRVLALTSGKRASFSPDWPTVAETAIPGFDASIWTGFFIKKGAPAEIVELLDREIAQALASAEVRSRFEAVGAEPMQMSRAEFGKLLANDAERFGAFIREKNIRAE